MTVVLSCLLIAVLIPYALAGISTRYKTQQFGKVDNNNPRAQAAQLTGTGARAIAAQQNAWEALAVFTAAVVAAFVGGADPETLATPALVFVAARIAHAFCYLRDLASPRSLCFGVGFFACLWIFVKAFAG